MKVINIHQRELDADPKQVGALIDTLASNNDRLWPNRMWPRMVFDKPLGIGADGGHGPIKYFVESYTPGKFIKFQFTGPKGFDGYHCYEVVDHNNSSCSLKHTLRMNTQGLAILSWPLIYRPMHDALIEDSLTNAEASLGLTPSTITWTLQVKLLRWIFSGGKARPQIVPKPLNAVREID